MVSVRAQDVAWFWSAAGQQSSQEQGGSHGAMGGQDRVNWALLSSISSQASPKVSHPSQSLCQHLKGHQKKRRGHNVPRHTQLLRLLTNEVWSWAPQMKLASEPDHSRRG